MVRLVGPGDRTRRRIRQPDHQGTLRRQGHHRGLDADVRRLALGARRGPRRGRSRRAGAGALRRRPACRSTSARCTAPTSTAGPRIARARRSARCARRSSRSSAARRRRKKVTAIAVLPLANMSADPENEYFSDGMTEEIINALVQGARHPGGLAHLVVRVQGRRTSTCAQIGEKLGVTSVLEGSVRKIGNRIRITAQLVNVENGYQLWSETYDRQLEDVFAIQDEISRAIVDALKLRLVGDAAAVVPPTKNLEAYTPYLKGRFLFNKFTELGLRKALDLFQHAAAAGPGLRPRLRRHRRRVVRPRRRLGGARRRVPAGEVGRRARAAARPGARRRDDLDRQGAVLARVELRRRRASRRTRRGAEPEQRRGALGARHRAAAGRAAARRRSRPCVGRSSSTRCASSTSAGPRGSCSTRRTTKRRSSRARKPSRSTRSTGAASCSSAPRTWRRATPRRRSTGSGAARASTPRCARTTR